MIRPRGSALTDQVLGIALVGDPGSGKSTTAQILRELGARGRRDVCVEKLAFPLYELQRTIYDRIGATIAAQAQDPALLATLASEIRRIDPGFLFRDFMARVAHLPPSALVINDDVRERSDCLALRRIGFEFWEVKAPPEVRAVRLGLRGDVSPAPDDRESAWKAARRDIKRDAVIENAETIEALRHRLKFELDASLQRRGRSRER